MLKDIIIGAAILWVGYMLTTSTDSILSQRKRWTNPGDPHKQVHIPDTRSYTDLRVGHRSDGTPYIIGGL